MNLVKEQVSVNETANSPKTIPVVKENDDSDLSSRNAIIQGIKSALRQPLTGEKRELGFIEKVECSKNAMFFHLKNATQTFKLQVTSPQSIQIRGFTPEIEQIKLGCNLKQVDIPVVFTFKADENLKAKSNGELISLEFVPRGFSLDK